MHPEVLMQIDVCERVGVAGGMANQGGVIMGLDLVGRWMTRYSLKFPCADRFISGDGKGGGRGMQLYE